MKIIGDRYALVRLEDDPKLKKANYAESPTSGVIVVTQTWHIDLHTGECHPVGLTADQL